MSRKRRGVRGTYGLALGALALLAICGQVAVQFAIAASHDDAALVNLSGQQRMLSQKIAKSSWASVYAPDADDRLANRRELAQALAHFSRVQSRLQQADLDGEALAARFRELSPYYYGLTAAGFEIARGGGEGASALDALAAIQRYEAEFLPRMNAIVSRYEATATKKLEALQRTETVLLIVMLVALGLVGVLVFEPQRRKIRRQFQELDDARTAAVDALESKEDFLATVSHEIRTPLNGVIGMNEMLLNTELSPEQREFARTGGRAADSLLTVIDDILDYRRLADQGVALQSHPFDIEPMVYGVAHIVVPELSPSIDLSVEIDPDVPDAIVGDERRVRQVLINLLNNAVKFTTRGEIHIHVRRVDGSIEFSVQDTGIGIPESDKEIVLQCFTQGDCSSTREFGGVGMGLAIVKGLADLMGGEVALESEEGSGTLVRFSMPCEPAVIVMPPPSSGPILRGRRVVVLDDRARGRSQTTALVRRLGASVDEFGSGQELLEHLDLLDADMFLVDGHLVGEDVTEVARAIRRSSRHARTPMVLVGWRSEQLGDSLRKQLAPAFSILKPIEPSSLRRLVAEGASRPRTAPTVERGTDTPFAGMRVLVVEDNDLNQRLMRSMLDKLGCVSEFAGHGQQALDRIAGSEPFDLILMDCQMPVMDGFEASRRIRQIPDYADVPILAVTANVGSESRRRCFDSGMDGYLAKPYRRADLVEKIETVMASGAGRPPQS